ncbi:MAG: glycine zipper 2TM domain-containing protein [Betaproteobacteria bacterium]|nr:MAG: glycine zipper 2TM domain-containing protein [Betaproteobacteria bacterium]
MESTVFRKTHPLMLGAAASVMVVSLVGAAAIGGLLPTAHSDKADTPTPAQTRVPATSPRHEAAPKLAARDSACASCGTVASIHTVALRGDATGLGAVAGGVTGAMVGNQIGRGNGNTAMTILGAAGGALAGNEIEKNVKKRYSYRVTVRMDDGTFRTISQSSSPAVTVGERVRVIDGAVVARS